MRCMHSNVRITSLSASWMCPCQPLVPSGSLVASSTRTAQPQRKLAGQMCHACSGVIPIVVDWQIVDLAVIRRRRLVYRHPSGTGELWRARPCRQWYTMMPSLYVTLSGTSSQCSSASRSWDKPRSNFLVQLTTRAAAFITRCTLSMWILLLPMSKNWPLLSQNAFYAFATWQCLQWLKQLIVILRAEFMANKFDLILSGAGNSLKTGPPLFLGSQLYTAAQGRVAFGTKSDETLLAVYAEVVKGHTLWHVHCKQCENCNSPNSCKKQIVNW